MIALSAIACATQTASDNYYFVVHLLAAVETNILRVALNNMAAKNRIDKGNTITHSSGCSVLFKNIYLNKL